MTAKITRPSRARKGNGPGWGGPAKGSQPRGEVAPTFEPGNQAAAGPHDFSRDDWRKFCLGVWHSVACDVAQPGTARSLAAEKAYDRVVDAPKTRVELGGPNGGPIQSVGITTTDPVEAARAYQRIISGA
jgi:hypothetical protein